MNPNVDSHRKRIDNVFQLAEGIDSGNTELRAHMARYLCVLVSGYLERSVRHIVDDYAHRNSRPEIYRYIAAQMKGFQNARPSKIIKIVDQFNSLWAANFARDIEGEIKDSVDSIVATRHQIAHGENTGITLANIREYYKSAQKLVALLERQLS